MKKTFLNLRKMGFVLVAATAMVAFSCGGDEAADEATEAIENLGDELNEALDNASENMDAAVEEATDSADAMACEAGACEGGDSCEGGDAHSCEHGE